MKSKFVWNEGTKLHYLVRDGSKPAIVLLHGAGSNHTVWRKVVPYLKGRKLILPDFRGHGKSARGKISLDHAISDLRTVLEKEKETSVDIVGYSLGATTASGFAKVMPHRIKKLALLSIMSTDLTKLSTSLRSLNLLVLSALKLFASKRKLTFQDYGNYRNVIANVWYDMKGTSLRAYFGAIEMVLANRIHLDKMKHNTILIQGRYDHSINKHALKKMLKKNVKLKYVSTHHLVVKKPEELGTVLKNFLIS